MRKLILKMSMSLDGFVAGPGGETDWVFRTRDPDSTAWTVATVAQAGIHAVGRKTWQQWTRYWPTATGPFAPLMNEIPKVVFTRAGLAPATPKDEESEVVRSWTQPRIASGDLATEIAALKREPGKPILAQGGAAFAQELVRLDLVDEYRLPVHPVVLGRGLPLFASAAAPFDLELVEATRFPNGTVGHVYVRRR